MVKVVEDLEAQAGDQGNPVILEILEIVEILSIS